MMFWVWLGGVLLKGYSYLNFIIIHACVHFCIQYVGNTSHYKQAICWVSIRVTSHGRHSVFNDWIPTVQVPVWPLASTKIQPWLVTLKVEEQTLIKCDWIYKYFPYRECILFVRIYLNQLYCVPNNILFAANLPSFTIIPRRTLCIVLGSKEYPLWAKNT